MAFINKLQTLTLSAVTNDLIMELLCYLRHTRDAFTLVKNKKSFLEKKISLFLQCWLSKPLDLLLHAFGEKRRGKSTQTLQ